jgi:malonyl CoA-acyl carrier protein transacylase
MPSAEATRHAHYACYLENLAMADLWSARAPACGVAAAYSMGLFPLLAFAGAATFDDGLRLMDAIVTATLDVVPAGDYAMGVIVGLTRDDVQARVTAQHPALEITDVYAPKTIITAGPRQAIVALVDECLAADGIEEAYPMPVTAPFHATALRAIEPRIEALLDGFDVRAPRMPIVSAITQRPLRTADDIRWELANNIWHPMAWFATVSTLVDAGVGVFVEAGTSVRLAEHARRACPETAIVLDYRDYQS